MKALGNISRINVRNETLMLLLDLYESKGKTFYYNDLFKRDFTAIYNKTLEEDIIEIANLLKLDMTEARIGLCSRRDFSPRTKDEQLLYNLKNVIQKVHENHDKFEIITNEAHELSKRLADNYEEIKWNRRLKDPKEELLNTSSKYVSKREDLEQLVLLFNKIKREKTYELTHLVTNFYVDFINMEIFDNLNDLIALIFLYTIVYKNFPIFSYVSFFKHFRKRTEQWNLALEQANYNWKTSFPKTDILSELLFQILIDAYQEVDDFAYEYEFEKKLNKSDSVENTILKTNGLFSKQDLRDAHPTVSDSTITRTLVRLRDDNIIRPIGTGRSAKWQLIKEVNKDPFSQLSIF